MVFSEVLLTTLWYLRKIHQYLTIKVKEVQNEKYLYSQQHCNGVSINIRY